MATRLWAIFSDWEIFKTTQFTLHGQSNPIQLCNKSCANAENHPSLMPHNKQQTQTNSLSPITREHITKRHYRKVNGWVSAEYLFRWCHRERFCTTLPDEHFRCRMVNLNLFNMLKCLHFVTPVWSEDLSNQRSVKLTHFCTTAVSSKSSNLDCMIELIPYNHIIKVAKMVHITCAKIIHNK